MPFQILPAILIAVASGLLIAASLHDVAFRTVPNWMPLALAAIGLTLHLITGGVASAAIAGLAVFTAAALCWRRGWMGGGDVKLLAAAATLTPPLFGMTLVLYVALAGGILALAYTTLARLVARPATGRPAGLLHRIGRAERYRIHRRGPLPYASAIAAGALLVLWKG